MKLSAAFGRNTAISKICGKIVITPIAVIRHCRKSAERRIIQNRFVDMTKAVFNSRHHITLQLAATLLAPCFLLREFHGLENTCATKSCEQRILSSAPPHRQARVACDNALIQ